MSPSSTKKSSRCRDCPIGCQIPQAGKKNKLNAYANLWGLDYKNSDFGDFVAAYHYLCDDIGLEAFETAAAIAVALKAGQIKRSFNGILNAVNEISQGTELGFILGHGAESARHIWGISSQLEAGPQKNTGRSKEEEIFLDSTGLCSFAYSLILAKSGLWVALDELLKAKYGPSFTIEKLKNMLLDVEHFEKQ